MTTLALLLLLALAGAAEAGTARDPKSVRDFRATHPCPHTGLTTGPCVGYVVDHKFPICAGGADAPENMMWQEYEASLVKDRVEKALCRCMKLH